MPRPSGWRRPREGFRRRPCRESEIRPRPRGGAGDRARRLHERRHTVAVGLRAGRIRARVGRQPCRRPRRLRRRHRPRNRQPCGSSSSGPRRPSSRGYFAADRAGLLRGREPDRQMVPGGADVDPAGRRVGSRTAPSSRSPGFRRSSRPARARRPISSTSPRSSSARGRCRCRGRTSNIDDPCDFAGKKVGVWDFGNEFEVTAGALACGLTPGLENNGDPAKQYQKVIQPFDMTLLLSRQIDVAEAMIYNEYAQVLEAQNPETGQLYKPEDLNVINWNDRRRRDAPGRGLRPQGVARPGHQQRHRGAVPPGLAQGLDLLPRPPR